MGAIRSSLFIVFVLMGVDKIITKPIFDDIFCGLLCTDDDGSTSTIASENRDWWDDYCNDCVDSSELSSINLIIPPSQVGTNFLLQNINGNWVANLTSLGQPTTARPTAGSSTPPAVTTASSAAPGGTTSGTTGAPTTAASG